jgi:hypothetical protein
MRHITVEQAIRLLAPVSYNQRMMAGRMSMPSGIHRELLGSICEVHCFLTPCSKSLPAIDFGRLADWIETVLQDEETAENLRNASAESKCYVDTCKAAYVLLGTRIEALKRIINQSASAHGGSHDA